MVDELKFDVLSVAGVDEIDVFTAGYAPEASDALLTEKSGNIRGDSEG